MEIKNNNSRINCQPLRGNKDLIKFGYKSDLKKVATNCFYCGDKFIKDDPKWRATLEHVKCHSKGGPDNITNYIPVHQSCNSRRGTMPFVKWLKKFPETIQNIQKGLNKLRGEVIDGHDYVKDVKPALNEEANGYVTFKGRLNKIG